MLMFRVCFETVASRGCNSEAVAINYCLVFFVFVEKKKVELDERMTKKKRIREKERERG